MKFSAAIAPATVLLSAARSVHAWGALGHRTVAVIAENYFTATTSAWVSDLLNGAKIDTIASFAGLSLLWWWCYNSRLDFFRLARCKMIEIKEESGC